MSEVDRDAYVYEEGYDPNIKKIDFDIRQLEFNHLRRKHAFFTGVPIQAIEEFTEEKKKKLRNFKDLPDVLPIKPKEDFKTVDYRQLVAQDDGQTEQIEEESKEKKPEVAKGRPGFVDYGALEGEKKAELLNKFELIKRRKIPIHEKPLAIIYNPASGKKTNLRPLITKRLDSEKVPYEFLETQKAFDTFRFARDLDIDKYSVLCATGGDGTYHEVINGMLSRTDGRKIPIALLPNGSGNDLCNALGIWSLDHALDYICSGEAIPLDSCRVLCDHKTEETLPEGEERYNVCRHFDVNCGIGLTAKVTAGAAPFKGCCGKRSYEVATIVQKCKGNIVPESFTVEVDGQKVEGYSDPNTPIMMFTNGKYTGAGMVINPFSCMNDGLVDVTWINDPRAMKLLGIAQMLDEAKKQQGTQAYKGQNVYMRGRKIEVTFNGRPGDKPGKAYAQQLIQLDGEVLQYDKFIVIDCIPENWECMFDTDAYFKEFKSFDETIPVEYEEPMLVVVEEPEIILEQAKPEESKAEVERSEVELADLEKPEQEPVSNQNIA